MSAYYNEIDPYAAQWLRNLIAAGHIAPGEVDERSISDVKPDDLRPFTQCHFFAGLGGWSAALRRAGWADDRRVWTASCPCQPFSQAGAGAGMDDERHLWPDFYWLAMQLGPGKIFGEQVASKDAESWLDLVQTDLEALGYAFGAVAFPSAGIGAPHIRDRTYWVGHASGQGLGECFSDTRISSRACGAETGQTIERAGLYTRGLADTDGGNASAEREQHGRQLGFHAKDGSDVRPEYRGARVEPSGRLERAGPVNGLWADADWLFCRDGKWRPVESSTFPLADGAPARVGRLRAYGNAINVEAAAQFIAAYMEI